MNISFIERLCFHSTLSPVLHLKWQMQQQQQQYIVKSLNFTVYIIIHACEPMKIDVCNKNQWGVCIGSRWRVIAANNGI